MTILNGYATLAQFKAIPAITSPNAPDDAVIEDMIERASRIIDGLTQKWFYSDAQTRYFDVPKSRCLELDAPLLAITTLTNGDGTVIASSEYRFEPRNAKPYYSVVLNQLSTTSWLSSTTTGDERVISIAGSWGYVDRSATDPTGMRYILATEQACLSIAGQLYRERVGNNQGGQVQVTAAGLVITPYGAIPRTAMDLLRQFMPKT